MSYPFPLPSHAYPNNCGDENVGTPIIINLIVSGENRNSMIKEPEKHLSVPTKLRNHANHAERTCHVATRPANVVYGEHADLGWYRIGCAYSIIQTSLYSRGSTVITYGL